MPRTDGPRRAARPGAGYPSAQLTGAEYVTVVALLGAAIIATALFVAWAAQQRGLLAPGTVPHLGHVGPAEVPTDG